MTNQSFPEEDLPQGQADFFVFLLLRLGELLRLVGLETLSRFGDGSPDGDDGDAPGLFKFNGWKFLGLLLEPNVFCEDGGGGIFVS